MKLFVAKAKDKFKSSNTVNSSVWVAGGMASGHIVRLISNLILTRLLVPEYFGIMAIVQSIIGFFVMMTDVGLLPSVINTKRDKEPVFMRTVWSVQLLVATTVCVMVLLAAYPISVFYEEPLLFPVLSFAAITSLFAGFNSVSLLIEQKHLRQKQLVINQFLSQFISSAVMILIALYSPTIWSIVIGNLFGVLFLLWASYHFFSNHFSTFSIDKSSLNELVSFGKWIFFSSIFSYISYRSRPLLLGYFLSLTQFGVYVIAMNLAAAIEAVSNSISNKVLAPRYRQLVVQEAFWQIRKIRFRFILLFLLPTFAMATLGETLVSFLYDERYVWAGAVLQLLAVGRLVSLFVYTSRPLLTALGEPKYFMYTQALSAFIGFSLTVVVGLFSGSTELLIVTIALLPIYDYVIVRISLNKQKMIFDRDLMILILSIMAIIYIWYLSQAESLKMLMDATQVLVTYL
jgi:O-antigen/teichoic acid export membrane protein